ncbi:MAG: hypothetical protein M3209_04015 [Acidobacteriota bacterium]|nr:hypothetical protein [Acidobacteriota bacterium]
MSDTEDIGIWGRLKIWTTTCATAAEVQNIKDSLDQAETALQAPHMISVVSKSRVDVGKVIEGIGAVRETIETIENICLDLRAINEIHAAMKILNDEALMKTNKAKAAEGFSDLFSGVGRLARHLPSPAKEWGEFIEKCGVLFVNIQRANDPATGERWRQLRQMQGMESLYR